MTNTRTAAHFMRILSALGWSYLVTNTAHEEEQHIIFTSNNYVLVIISDNGGRLVSYDCYNRKAG